MSSAQSESRLNSIEPQMLPGEIQSCPHAPRRPSKSYEELRRTLGAAVGLMPRPVRCRSRPEAVAHAGHEQEPVLWHKLDRNANVVQPCVTFRAAAQFRPAPSGTASGA